MSSKSEKEKMLAGENYNILDPELEVDRQKNKKLLYRLNQTEEDPDRYAILQQMLGAIGQDSIIWAPFYMQLRQEHLPRRPCFSKLHVCHFG